MQLRRNSKAKKKNANDKIAKVSPSNIYLDILSTIADTKHELKDEQREEANMYRGRKVHRKQRHNDYWPMIEPRQNSLSILAH